MAWRINFERPLLSIAISVFTFVCASQLSHAQPASKVPDGATTLMRVWTDKGTLWASCIHPSCVEGSTVSMRVQPPSAVPAPAEFHAQQTRLVNEGTTNSGGVLQPVGFAKPSVQRSRHATTMIVRGRYERPGEAPVFITRGMIYCGACTVSVVSSSSSKKRADEMFRYGYAHCKKR
jgi:hypothetical protein